MKLSFTTLGCPAWNLDKILSEAKRLGYDGIDFRGYLAEVELFKLPEFTSDIANTRKAIDKSGLEVSAVSSSARAFSKTDEDRIKCLNEVKEYLKIADALGSPYVRIFGGKLDGTPYEKALQMATENVKAMAKALSGYKANIIIETHDEWIDSSRLKALLDNVGSDRVFALWDVHHPYRMGGEAPSTTWKNIGGKVRYTHFKDSIKTDDKGGYKHTLLGKGDIPLKEIVSCLKKGGYTGYLTLEWEKRWHKDMEEPEIAFPQYIEEMRKLIKSA